LKARAAASVERAAASRACHSLRDEREANHAGVARMAKRGADDGRIERAGR